MIPQKGIDDFGEYYQKIDYFGKNNFEGKENGRLTVLFRAKNEKGTKKWLCRCNCGKIKMISCLPNTKSCGCIKKEQMSQLGEKSKENLSMKTFGNFKALKENINYKKLFNIKSKNAYWDCECLKCHKITTINSADLKRKRRKCIFCKGSVGEQTIFSLLKENSIIFLFDFPYFKDLLLPGGGVGRYDFILFTNGTPTRIIEYNGEQHFQENNYFKASLKKIKQYDEIKNNYAKEKSIPLVRIPFSRKKDLQINDLLGNKYLIN